MIEHFDVEYPREACGLIISGQYYPCKNIATSDEDFRFDTKEYLALVNTYGMPDFIVHTHPDCSPEPTEIDIANCNALNVPFKIYSYPSLEEYILYPSKTKQALLGRHYKFGVSDCFQAAWDWYYENGVTLPNRLPFEDDWWLKDLDYFNQETMRYYGFNPVDSLKYGDLIVLAVGSETNNHCGVYLGSDVFYHHAVNRLSCRENLYPFWHKFMTGIYRYEKKSISKG